MTALKCFLLMLAGSIVPVSAQTGWLEGTVRDTSAGVLRGVLISCLHEETGFRFTINSSETGEYRFAAPEGHYQMAARLPGFRTVALVGVEVAPGAAKRIDFQLELDGVRETVTVGGRDTQEPAIGGGSEKAVSPGRLPEVPLNSRTVTGLLQFEPGLLVTPANGGEAGQFSNLGARPNTNHVLVDGVSANNAVAGAGWPSFLPGAKLPTMTALGTTHTLALFDAIDEVRVQAPEFASGPAEAAGAGIVVLTRPGSNAFHGSLTSSARPSRLAANDWFANRFALGPDDSSLHDESGSAGGPLRHNHTYFFIAAERLDLRQSYSWTTTVPSLAARSFAPLAIRPLLEAFPLPNGPVLNGFGIAELIGHSRHPAAVTSGNLRIDHDLDPRTRAFVRLSFTPSRSESGFAQPNLLWYWDSAATLALNRTGTWTQDFRLGFRRTQVRSIWPKNQADSETSANFYSTFPSLAADFSMLSIGGAGSVASGDAGRNRQEQIQISHAARRQIGRHQLGVGIEYFEWRPERSGPKTALAIAFSSPIDLIYGPAAPVWVTQYEYRESSSRLWRMSGYLQDTWKIHERFTATLGLRWLSSKSPIVAPGPDLYSVSESDFSIVSHPLAPATPLWRMSPLELDPKVAVAWRPSHSEATVVRASWSLFHDGDFAVATDQLNGTPYSAMRSPAGLQIGPSPLIPAQLGYGFASDLRLPRFERWSVDLQHSWSRHDTTGISYAGMAATGLLRRETWLYPDPPLTQLSFGSSKGESVYNGLHLFYSRALTSGLQARVTYFWSHSIDLGSSDSSWFAVAPGQTARRDRGDSDFDVRQSLSVALSYTTALRSALLRQWTLGALTYARTAFPVSVLTSETLDGVAAANYRPDFTSAPLRISDAGVPGGSRLNPQAFAIATDQGNLGRNAVRGFGAWQSDVSLGRELRVSTALRLNLRADAFNVLNHAQFADPGRFLSNPMFGEANSQLNLMMGSGSPSSGQAPTFLMGGPRSLQVSVRMRF